MNRIFRIVWNRAIGQMVVTSEHARSNSRGGRTAMRGALGKPFALTGLALALAFAMPAHAANLAMPSGALLDINNGSAPNSASNVANQFQTYSVTYTATDAGNNYILFAFRQDPSYWTFGNVGLYAAGSSTNLFTDPLLSQGGTYSSQSNLQAPAGFGIVYQTGTTPRAAGVWQAPGTSGASTTNVNQGSAGSWYDGAVGSFDGIYQGVDLVAGMTYTISFTAMTTGLANTAGTGSSDIEMGVFAGKCVSLSGPVTNCTPDNPNFTVAATPSQTQNAGSPPTVINQPTTTTTLGTNAGRFDGGTLVVDQTTDPTLSQNFTVTGHGGTIDQAGHTSTVSGTISDDTAGTPGSLTVANSGQGGGVTLTGTNTYTGHTTIDNGATLAIGGTGSIASSNGVTDNGMLDVSGATHDVIVNSIDGQGNVALGSNNLIVSQGDGTALNGTISGTGGLEVNGGTQVLGGTNTYSGGTQVSNATVQIANDQNLGAASGGLALNNGTLHTTGNVTTARNVTVTGNGTFNTDANTTTTDSGTVSGNGALIKSGTGTLAMSGTLSHSGGTTVNGGTLVLSGTNTYTGGNTVNTGGTLQVGNDANLGAQANGVALNGGTLHTTGNVTTARNVTVTGNGTFDTDANTTTTDSGTVSGSGALIKSGAGTLAMSGTLSHTGGTTVNGGTLVLSGTNTYTGGNTVNTGGTLQVGNDANLGAQANGVALNNGTLHTTGNVTTARNVTVTGNGTFNTDANTTTTDTGTVSGNGALIKSGTGTLAMSGTLSHSGGTTVNGGTLVLSGTNTYTGGNTVNAGGTLQVGNDANLGAQSNGVALNGGTLHTTGNVTTARNVTVTGNGTFDTDANTTTTDTGAVSGAGALVKNGLGTLDIEGVASHTGGTTVNEGTLVLGGANTYTGGNTLNGGTLQIASDANLGDASNGIAFDGGSLHTTGSFTTARDLSLNGSGTIATDAGTTVIANGSVSGASGLVKNGLGTLDIEGVASHTGGTTVNEGTLVLGGANTYTGGNTLNGGTLQIASDANLGDASNGIAFDGGSLHTTGSFTTARDLSLNGSGTIATDAGTTVIANGSVSGASGLVKNGLGTLDIEGVASHTGGTTVNEGTLVLGGANTYTGGNTLNGGTLQIASDANLGDASNGIAFNGGNLTVTRSMNTSRGFSFGPQGASITTLDGVTLGQQGDLSGTGGLTKLGGGTLVVSGNNTFTGGTLIRGGVIRIDSGSSLGTGQILLQGGMLETVATLATGQQVLISGQSGVNVDAGTSTVLSGSLSAASGDACFVKSGMGRLSLTGNAMLGSGTCVQQGELAANGMLTSSFVEVDQGATLRGIGAIDGPVTVSGRLAPGASPGTLTVNGDVTMSATSTLQMDIDGLGTAHGVGNYARLLVVGAGHRFFANGVLQPLLRGMTGSASNTYTPPIGTTFRIVTADGGVTGRFSAIQPSDGLPANARFVAFYGVNDGHSIDLRVAPVSYASLLGAGATRNDLAVAQVLSGTLDAQGTGTATAVQTGLLYAATAVDAAHVGAMVNGLSGEVHADEAAAARAAGLGIQRDVADHLGTDAQASTDHRVWANLTRDGNRSVADNQGSGFETGTDRTTAGVDLYADNGTVIGLGGTHHDTNVISHGGSGSIRGNSGFVYAQQALGSALLDGMAGYGTTDWSTHRADPLGGSSIESRTSGKDLVASATVRFPMQTAAGNRVEPYASVIWQKVERDAANEGGTSLAALSLDSLSQKGTRVLGGVTMGSKAADPLASTLTWRAGIAVGADTGDLLDPTVHSTLAGQRFDTAAPGVGRGFVQLNANGTMRLGKGTYLYGGLTAEEGRRRSSYGVTAGIRVAF
ncbi:autotransporter-associated beta strand repeat-containing protein [Luteibacter sp. PPL554]